MDGYWCRTTLYYRTWAGEEIEQFLPEEDATNADYPGSRYYRIERVLWAEKYRDSLRRLEAYVAEQKRRRDAISALPIPGIPRTPTGVARR